MRIAFIDTLTKLARKDKNIYLLSSDMGFSVFENFRNEFPDRFLNMGIAEANMASVAAGLALCGKTVYIYSFIPFATMRCFEQIRIDICYHNANVKIIGLGEGLTYALEGPTHHAIEDIAIMRALPNMKVICPGDPVEVKLAIEASAQQKGPMYLRIGKKGEAIIHPEDLDFEIGKGIIVRDGQDLTLISTGNMLHTALSVSKLLENSGISSRVISMHTVKPIDKKLIIKSASDTGIIFSLEEHSLIGGMGSAVAEILAEEENLNCFFRRIALPDMFVNDIGSQDHLRSINFLSVDGIFNFILREYKNARGEKKFCKN